MNVEKQFECIQKAILKSTELSGLEAEQEMRSYAQSQGDILSIKEAKDMCKAYKELAIRTNAGVGSCIKIPKGTLAKW